MQGNTNMSSFKRKINHQDQDYPNSKKPKTSQEDPYDNQDKLQNKSYQGKLDALIELKKEAETKFEEEKSVENLIELNNIRQALDIEMGTKYGRIKNTFSKKGRENIVNLIAVTIKLRVLRRIDDKPEMHEAVYVGLKRAVSTLVKLSENEYNK